MWPSRSLDRAAIIPVLLNFPSRSMADQDILSDTSRSKWSEPFASRSQSGSLRYIFDKAYMNAVP